MIALAAADDSNFSRGFKVMERLEAFYSEHGYAGLGSIWTPYGPYFFDLAKVEPLDLALGLAKEYGADYATVCEWLENVSDDCLH